MNRKVCAIARPQAKAGFPPRAFGFGHEGSLATAAEFAKMDCEVKNITRANHYVPQHLLRNFTDGSGKLWVYDAESNKCWGGKSKSAGFECKLYPPEIEKIFTQIIDTPGAEAISGLLQHEQLNGTQWSNFIRFIAAQMQRTPACFDRAAAIFTPTFQETAERIAKFHEGFRRDMRNSLEQSGATAEEIAGLFRALEAGQFKVTPTKEFILAQSLQMIELLETELRQMRWGILGVPNGEPDLIIGDQPVMLYDAGPDDEPPGPLGIRNKNIELVIPLGRRMVAIARWTGPDSFGELLNGSAALVNERTLRYARRFVFAAYRSDSLLAETVRLHGTGPKIHVSRIQIGEKLVIVPEYR